MGLSEWLKGVCKMNDDAGDNRFYPSVSPASFSFFDGQTAKIEPSYLLFPNVRLSDLRISLSLIRTRSKERRARLRNIAHGQMTPFGLRQVSFKHMINRFRQPKTQLKDVVQEAQADYKKEGFKAIAKRIMALTGAMGQFLTLEENEELRQLRTRLSPTVKANEEKLKEEFKAVWQTIQANGISGNLTTGSND